jgi:cell division septation protein DedD
MNGGRPAALDGSLLARKGDAVPAIPDESPLVLNLDDHRPEPEVIGPEPVNPAPAGPVKLSQVEQGNASADFPDRVTKGLARASGRIDLISSRVRWAATIAVTVLIVAILWLSNSSGETAPVQAQGGPVGGPVAESGNDGLGLNLAAVPEAPAVSVVFPTSAAMATAAPPSPPDSEAVVAKLEGASGATVPLSARIIPVSVPASETAPPVGNLDSAPKIPGTLPKSVSPIPIPKAKPDVAAIPVSGRYAVQLASIAIEKRANQEAFRLQKQLGHILGGHKIEVEKAVVAGKGTMYRLRAGGYQTQAEARSTCAQLSQLKVNCLALRR